MQLFNFELKAEDNLLKIFEDIHNYIYANDGLTPQQTLGEFIKILFVKIFDENLNENKFHISEEEFANTSNGQILPFIDNINVLFDRVKTEYIDMFDNDEKIKLSNISLAFTVNKLQNISLTDSSNDSKGLAFQKFLTHNEKEGNGQFFTPEPVVDFCVDIIDPKLGETIIDPCCGSGGFLFSAYKHILDNNPISKEAIIKNQLFGFDINKNITQIAKMKFLLEQNIPNNIFCNNSLGDLENLINLAKQRNTELNGGFDVILTNPPFGTAGKITDNKMLGNFELGYKWTKHEDKYIKTKVLANGQPAEILFVERCLQLLKEGGRMGIVLPNGHFENPSLSYLRSYIKDKAQILSVVNLPQETFIPYGTGVKTSLLFLEKKDKSKQEKYSIFFGKVNKIGYQGNKNGTPIYKKDKYGQVLIEAGHPILDEDFSVLSSQYSAFKNNCQEKSSISFSVYSDTLADRFDYDYYSPDNQELLSKLNGCSVKLGDIVDIVKCKSPKLKNKVDIVEYIELSDVNTHSFEIINSTKYTVHELPSRASYELEENDIITAIAGNSVGTRKHATALVPTDYKGAICTNGFRVLRNSKIDKYYLLYFLHSDLFLKQMMRFRTGATIPSVSDSDLSNILVYMPEQSIIDGIGQQMRRSFDLRKESTKIIEEISI